MQTENPRVSFGKRLRQLRKRKGLSQEALAYEAGLDRSYVGGVERGEYNISLLNICILADALNLPPDELLRFADSRQSAEAAKIPMNEELEKLAENILNHILRQIDRDSTELAALQPAIDWHKRVVTTAGKFIPVIVQNAANLIREVEQSLNSPQTVRAIWNDLKNQLQDERFKKSVNAMDSALSQEQELLSVITGETVSKLIADFLCRAFGNLAQNNRSTYPDLYFTDIDYSVLPRRSRDLAKGPALRGINPTSVPDGIEIKSNNGTRIRVDSHHPHQGLHLALTFNFSNNVWRVYDVYLAYLSEADYTQATRRTTATTEKFSFGHAPFISATTGSTQQGELTLEESTS